MRDEGFRRSRELPSAPACTSVSLMEWKSTERVRLSVDKTNSPHDPFNTYQEQTNIEFI